MHLMIPERKEIEAFPEGTLSGLQRGLISPIQDFLSRPGKGIRQQLVELGYRFSGADHFSGAPQGEQAESCLRASGLIDALHAGSLIIDDIEDRALIRRGRPSLHTRYGIPIALNAGNWLYFRATSQVEQLGLSPERELICHRLVQKILMQAHFGQAIDIATPIDQVEQARVSEVVRCSIELKTGALTALAMALGGIVGGASESRLRALESLGRRLGVGLQMMDDLGNLFSTDLSKRHEDLYLRRPTWPWAFASEQFEARDYQAFVHAVRCLPDESFLNPWLKIHDFEPRAKLAAREHLEETLEAVRTEFAGHLEALDLVARIIHQLGECYG